MLETRPVAVNVCQLHQAWLLLARGLETACMSACTACLAVTAQLWLHAYLQETHFLLLPPTTATRTAKLVIRLFTPHACASKT